ncbi:Frataxin-like domain-domain-containing protein, partial [Leucosporidium creatinivorum]
EYSDLSTQSYRQISDQTMDRLTEYLEEMVEELGEQGEEVDVEYSAGVLTLKLGDSLGTYVINKQPPNKQIWLSSPLSGPKRYDYDPTHRVWFYARDGKRLKDLLDEELSQKLGRVVSVRVED